MYTSEHDYVWFLKNPFISLLQIVYNCQFVDSYSTVPVNALWFPTIHRLIVSSYQCLIHWKNELEILHEIIMDVNIDDHPMKIENNMKVAPGCPNLLI